MNTSRGTVLPAATGAGSVPSAGLSTGPAACLAFAGLILIDGAVLGSIAVCASAAYFIGLGIYRAARRP